MRQMLTMTVAQPADLAQVMEILAETSAWLVGRGIQQWPSPPPPAVHQLMAREISAGQVYLANLPESAVPVGMLRFEWRGDGLWPHDAGDAGYVHSLAVRPGFHRRQLGQAMLGWAGQHVRGRQRRYLRLDCAADNQVLREYYKRLGYHFRGVATDGDFTGARFELDLNPPNR
jgi:ribosomal protein S18 acetylase RimI-like enzyme